MKEKFTVSLIVSNHFGVLNRVSGLYSKRNYNIDSLAVGVTENPEYSRITIVSTGDDYMKEQVVKQLEKLHDVKKVVLLDRENSIGVEHMLIKLRITEEAKPQISGLVVEYGGNILDFSNEFVTAEITGSSEKIDNFIEEARKFGILEVCRSGLIAMIHGTENIMSVNDIE
ncbi:MAG: acetolactate synthase small subunit [Clostridiales bacterium]|nr:acetolactate synthase small subunit [Clostridiales bacterium]